MIFFSKGMYSLFVYVELHNSKPGIFTCYKKIAFCLKLVYVVISLDALYDLICENFWLTHRNFALNVVVSPFFSLCCIVCYSTDSIH